MSTITWPIVGVDPGGRWTGIVLRTRDDCIDRTVVERGNAETLAPYLGRVIDEVARLHLRIVGYDAAGSHIAVEDLNDPTPQMGTTSVRGLIGTAQVLGAIVMHWPAVTLVPPGAHGSKPLAAYPRELVGDREKSGAGVLRHARSAWDVAGAAIVQARIDAMAGDR